MQMCVILYAWTYVYTYINIYMQDTVCVNGEQVKVFSTISYKNKTQNSKALKFQYELIIVSEISQKNSNFQQ